MGSIARMTGTTRPRIALVVPWLDHGGGVRTVADFLRRNIKSSRAYDLRLISLAVSYRDPCNVSIMRPWTWARGVGTRDGIFNGDAFVHVGANMGELEFRRYTPRAALRRLTADCDLVQVVAGTPCWAWALRDCGKPVVLQVATLTAIERHMRNRNPRTLLDQWRRFMTRVVAHYDKVALGSVHAVMVENLWMLDHVKAVTNGTGAIVRYAPPGVDTGVFHPAARGQPIAEAPYILSVGRFSDPRKNSGLLLEAYARMCAGPGEWPRLVMAGSSGLDKNGRAHLQALGLCDRVEFRHSPSQDELAKLYRGALGFVLSSDEEGFGMVVIEAMASGIPVVATRCGGPDGIITDGEDGFLVDRDDAVALAARLARIAREPSLREEMGRKARATVDARYCEKVAIRPFLEVYDALLSSRQQISDE